MSQNLIYSIEDDENILELLSYNLTKDGYIFKGFTSGEDAFLELSKELPQCILLDLMLPGINGLDICKKLKNDDKLKQIPIIMLTAKGEEADIVTGLELGADDYIVKPFSPKILIARMRAILRRNQDNEVNKPILEFENLKIDLAKYEVFVQEKKLHLTLTEFKILHFLAKKYEWVYTRSQIIENVHGENYLVTDRSIDVLIVNLRKKLGIAGNYIKTIRGIGYKFTVE